MVSESCQGCYLLRKNMDAAEYKHIVLGLIFLKYISDGMFVQAEKLVEAHQGRIDDISIYGQESNQTTYRLCRMNLAIRDIDGSNVR